MAKENTIFMMGILTEKPTIKVNTNKEFVVARIKIMTVRRSWANEELRLRGTPRTDIQYVITRNSGMIEKYIVPLTKGDVVLVKGSLSTRETKKRFTCPHCGIMNIYEGSVMVYVDPIFIEKVNEHDLDEEKATEQLLTKAEISNYAFIFGTLCRDPEYFSEDGQKEECDFQIATNRKRRIIEDGPDKKTDYPYVKTYGPKTREYSEVLHTGSEIFINGAIQSREITMHRVCGECYKEFEAQGATMEIVPYSIEYVKNCDIPHQEMDIGYVDEKLDPSEYMGHLNGEYDEESGADALNESKDEKNPYKEDYA